MKKDWRKASIEEIAKKIQWPIAEWPGNCYTLACMIAPLVGGTPVYGHWTGPVAPGSMFSEKPIVQHGWILLKGNTVIDPTRYVFEGREPYIYDGIADFYDEGGNALRATFRRPCPEFDYKEGGGVNVPFSAAVVAVVDRLMAPAKRHVSGRLSKAQVFWLANLPYDAFGPGETVRRVYGALSVAGYRAAIPVDNYRRAEREEENAT